MVANHFLSLKPLAVLRLGMADGFKIGISSGFIVDPSGRDCVIRPRQFQRADVINPVRLILYPTLLASSVQGQFYTIIRAISSAISKTVSAYRPRAFGKANICFTKFLLQPSGISIL
jgi:hypothetical protein